MNVQSNEVIVEEFTFVLPSLPSLPSLPAGPSRPSSLQLENIVNAASRNKAAIDFTDFIFLKLKFAFS